MRSSRSPASMPAFPMRRSRPPTRCRVAGLRQAHAYLDLLTPGLVFADTAALARRSRPTLRRHTRSPSGRSAATGRRHQLRRSARDRADRPRSRRPRCGSAPTPSPRSCSPRARPAAQGVINTQRMLCSNQAMIATMIGVPRRTRRRSVVDWLPWHHTSGGNHNFGLALRTAARCTSTTAGRGRRDRRDRAQSARDRAHGLFQRAQGLRGAAAASRARTQRLRARFFSRLRLIFYAGASAAGPLGGAEALCPRDDRRAGADADRARPTETAPFAHARRSSTTAPGRSACRRPGSS